MGVEDVCFEDGKTPGTEQMDLSLAERYCHS